MRYENNSWITQLNVSLIPPSLKDNTADSDRLKNGIEKKLPGDRVEIPFHVVKYLPSLLRKYNYKCRVILYRQGDRWRVIDLFPPGGEEHLYGAAVDLGSSTVVLRFVDLLSGDTLDESSFMNPQHEIGSDILSRIHFASEENGKNHLQEILIKRINREIKTLAEKHDVMKSAIVTLAAAGNTAMTHFFLGLDPYWICREPYIPAINTPDVLSPSDIGLDINPGGPVIVIPCVGSYLGGDVLAGILSSDMSSNSDVSMLIDVGTNAEVVLGNSEWLLACAGAAGPALEGGVAGMGMMAGPGAIDHVYIDPVSREIKIRTIDNIPAVGICGSGLIDLAGQLFMSGMIDLRGQFNKEKCSDRLVDIDGVKNLVIVPSSGSSKGEELYLNQTDIDALLRSKAAMYTILNTITNMANLEMNEISSINIAGTFGAYIDPVSAISLGMMPDLPLSKYVSLGNTSLEGVTGVLISAKSRDDIYKIKEMVTYIELNVNQEFMNNFNAAKFIPHTDRSLFPSVKEWG
ncbi:ASKHA domain-containing protein [Thermodesulfobacteriota bacterium]